MDGDSGLRKSLTSACLRLPSGHGHGHGHGQRHSLCETEQCSGLPVPGCAELLPVTHLDSVEPRPPRRGSWRRAVHVDPCHPKAWHAGGDPDRNRSRGSVSFLGPSSATVCPEPRRGVGGWLPSTPPPGGGVYRRLREPIKWSFWDPGEKGNPVATAPTPQTPTALCW